MVQAQAALAARGLLVGDALTIAGRELREAVETVTDLAMAPVVTSLGGDLDAVVAQCEAWSQAVLDRGWFPPDPYKRAAG